MEDFNIDDLHGSVNDIYEQFDEGNLSYEEATSILMRCCRAFLEFNQEMEDDQDEE